MRWTLALTLACAAPAGADTVRAVVVGVGDYLHLEADLRGPPQDAALVARALMARGVDPALIAVLATGTPDLPAAVAQGPAPTRAAILSALEDAAGASAPGDTVFVHFSGHGSLAPDRDGDEGGGPDQILLPMDARGWRGATGDVENAIYDDELQDWARALLARGVRVVAVLDACHSGTGFRAAPGAGVARQIDPALLGVPGLDGGFDPGAPPQDPAPLPGDFAFVYAARQDQRAFEFPQGDIWHGAFTLAFAQALTGTPDLTWAEALALARTGLARGSARQDPDGEGPLLSAPVFGAAAPAERFLVEGGVLAAGLLDGLAEGTRVRLTDAAGRALAEAHLIALTAATAGLDPPAPAGARWAELLAPPAPPPLRLAAPVRADPADGQDYGPWLAALDLARAEGLTAEGPPDLIPVLTAGEIALAGPDGLLDPAGPGSTPRIRPRPGEDPQAATLRMVQDAGHSLRLRRVLAGLTGRSPATGGRLTVTVERRPAGPQGCAARADPASGRPQDPALGLAPCDELWLTLHNGSTRPQDVTVLYLAQDFTVTPVWPRSNLSTRLAPGGTARAGMKIEPGTPPNAVEEILVVAVAPGLRAGLTPLSRLAAPGAIRGTGDLAAIDALLDPGAAARAFTARIPDLALIRLPVRILPEP